MATVAEFSGQDNPGLPVQMTKGSVSEDNTLDHIVANKDGKLWVFYSRLVAATYKIFYRTYVPDTDTWGSETEFFPAGASGTYDDYGWGRGIAKINREGDICLLYTLGTDAGSGTQWVRILRSDGTIEDPVQVPDVGGTITRDLTLANGCFDFCVVDTKGIAEDNIRAIDFSSSSLTFGNERFLYHETTHGFTLYNYSVSKGRASYNPISNTVECCTHCQVTNIGTPQYKLLYCREGKSPVIQDVPSNLITSTVYLVINPQFCCDNIDDEIAYCAYAVNAITAGSDQNFTETVMFRKIEDGVFGSEELIYQVSGASFGGGEVNGVYVDGHGNVHIVYRHCPVQVRPNEYMFGAPALSTSPFGYAYRRKIRSSSMWSDEQEVFFSDGRNPGAADYLTFGAGHTDIGARPFPTLARLFVAAVGQDENGAGVDAEEGIYVNYADVLDPAIESPGLNVSCAGQDVLANEVAHRQFLFDNRAFTDPQDDLGIE